MRWMGISRERLLLHRTDEKRDERRTNERHGRMRMERDAEETKYPRYTKGRCGGWGNNCCRGSYVLRAMRDDGNALSPRQSPCKLPRVRGDLPVSGTKTNHEATSQSGRIGLFPPSFGAARRISGRSIFGFDLPFQPVSFPLKSNRERKIVRRSSSEKTVPGWLSTS